MTRFAKGTRREFYKAKNIKDAKIPSYHSLSENVSKLQKMFLIMVFWFKYISPVIFKIGILDYMLLLKNSVPFKGLHYSSGVQHC